MAKAKDLTGQKFNHLIVKYRGENDSSGHIRWWCECDCGNPKLVLVESYHLKTGHTKSCGCHNQMMRSITHKRYNYFDLSNDFGICYMNDNNAFIFDLEDYNKIKNICWHINNCGYIIGYSQSLDKEILLHKLIMDDVDNLFVIDHIKHNLLDVRKSELRYGDNSKNGMNRKKQKNNTTGITGVYKWDDKWLASIKINGKQINLGIYIKKEDAIKARKEAEEKYFGEWSYDNSMKR